jgi:hypothetical protein
MKLSGHQILVRILIFQACLVLLAIVGFAVWRVRLKIQVSHTVAELRAQGFPTSGTELNALYPVVPNSENGALVVTQAIALIKGLPGIELPARGKSLAPEQHAAIADCLEKNQAALTKLQEAALVKRSHYPVDLTLGFDALLPHLPALEKISKLISYRVAFDLKSGEEAKATGWIATQLSLAHTLDAEPTAVSQSFRANQVSAASQLVERALNETNLNESEILKLSREFERFDTNSNLALGLTGELATLLPYFQKDWGEIRRIMFLGPSQEPISEALGAKYCQLIGRFDRDELFFIHAMTDAIDEAKKPFPDCLAPYLTLHEVALAGSRQGFLLGPGFLNGFRNGLIKMAEMPSRVRLTKTALAIERFRLAREKLPEKLDELIPQFLSTIPDDPFDGQPLRYHRLEKGYVIYSVGSDGEDNGGRERPAKLKSTDKTHYDITFTVER